MNSAVAINLIAILSDLGDHLPGLGTYPAARLNRILFNRGLAAGE